MATLNTLRTKMGWLLMVVIGFAMLAFILGDLSDSGSMLFNRKKMQVGEINGQNIGYNEFSNRYDYYKTIRQLMTGSQSLSETDYTAVKDEAWQNVVSEIVMEPGYQKLGLTNSEAEQIDMVGGTFISPVIAGIFTNPQTGMFDKEMLRVFVSNISEDASGSAEMLWNYFKTNMNKERLSSKYITLVGAGMFVTDLDVENAVADESKKFDVSYVSAPYSLVADSLINVTASDVKKYYEQHKNNYLRTAARDIEYVVFDVLPSEEDFAAADKTIKQMTEEFTAAENPMQYVTLNSHKTPDEMFYKENELVGELAILASKGDRKAVVGPTLNATTYTVSRIADVKMLPDSVGAKHILLAHGNTTSADSIIKAVKGGASFAELAQIYSLDQSVANNGGDLGHFAPQHMVADFANAVIAAKVGELFTVETQFGLHVIEKTFTTKPVKKTQIATLTYEVEPSSFTEQGIYAKASKFATAAAGSLQNFNNAVSEEALSKRVARVQATESNVSGLEHSTELVRWAFTEDEGSVSQIMEIDGDYVVAALTSVQLDGFAPVEKVSAEILPMVRNQKKAEVLTAKAQGATLEEVAAALNTDVQDINDVVFSAFYLDGIGIEPGFVGAVTAGKEGVLSKPVEGGNGVYLFTVNKANDAEAPAFEDQKVRLQAMSESYIAERVTQALMLKSNIKDYRVKFF